VIYEPEQTVTLALSLTAAPQKESNIKFTYVFSQLLDSAVVAVV
jgi:hypothetical protein